MIAMLTHDASSLSSTRPDISRCEEKTRPRERSRVSQPLDDGESKLDLISITSVEEENFRGR